MSNYLQTVADVYAEAADKPDATLCCVASPVWHLPDLRIPQVMQEMNYGCGSTVDPRDLRGDDTILYVGVGGGLEALQFAYFTRRPGSVIAVDPVAEMREKARANFEEAARLNPWFRPDFIRLHDGNALDLPVSSASASVAAQNCLFNVFTSDDLERALSEVIRVLRPGGRFATSDPITPIPLPASLVGDARLRARCISGCQTFEDYLAAMTHAGFGKVEVRARFPYRYLHPNEYPELLAPVMLESVEVTAYKVPDGVDGPAIFTGRTATYFGTLETFDDGHGNLLRRGMPTPISDAAAQRFGKLKDVVLTPSTWHSKGGGCC
ncbi:MAG: arsenosugar biosynthesis arsenite methyltransferase ArsM [Gemmataceae bacterium]|nr:arsenosugar biosynthesis arsenite methyltransferase ArsM [Gemmataceae bacterium]